MVATGECASKFWMGSILPLVEIRLRMELRTTVVVRTFKGPGLVKIGIRASATITPTASHVRPLLDAGRPFELWFVANRLSFKPQRALLQVSIYHSDRCERTLSACTVAWLDAVGGSRMPEG